MATRLCHFTILAAAWPLIVISDASSFFVFLLEAASSSPLSSSVRERFPLPLPLLEGGAVAVAEVWESETFAFDRVCRVEPGGLDASDASTAAAAAFFLGGITGQVRKVWYVFEHEVSTILTRSFILAQARASRSQWQSGGRV